MKTIALLSRDRDLAGELAEALPEGIRVATSAGARAEILFYDIDTLKPGGIREAAEGRLVIAVTGQRRTGPVIEATSMGAYEVLQRPLGREKVRSLLGELDAYSRELMDIVPAVTLPPTPTCAIVGHSGIIMDVCKKMARLSQVDAQVLITGETGTGKELIAESIAQLSSRFGKPFVVINCAAVPEQLLESELFGFEKGSFTGAVAPKEGMLRIADTGTVFFDEVGELPLPLQAKLLRFLQTQTFYPLGSTREVQVDVRVISATNRDLAAMVREGRFREDLYHRLSVTTIHIPPLRQRKKDILPLVNFFIRKYQHTARQRIAGVTREYLRQLTSHDWPGNIRELENVIRSSLALCRTSHLTSHELRELQGRPLTAAKLGPADSLASVVVPFVREAIARREPHVYEKLLREVDRTVIDYVLSSTRENQSEAARLLGINRLTLRKKLGLALRKIPDRPG